MKMVIETSRPIAKVAKELGINEGTLGNWVSIYRREHAGEEPPLTVSKHSPHVLRVICGSGSAALYGEIACAGGCQGVPSMRSHRTAKAFRPCLRAVSM